MSTIKDVAREAGVSIATVSYVLSKDKRITQKTAEKVQRAIVKLNYIPNLAAQGLKTSKLPVVIIILNTFAGPIYQSILDAMVKVFSDKNYNVLISSGKNGFSFIESNQVLGAIVLNTSVRPEQMTALAVSGCVIADRRHLYTKKATYSINYIDGIKPSKEAIDLAFKEGYHKIMYVHGAKDSIDDNERYQGYLASHQEHHVEPFKILDGNFTEDSGYDAIKNYLETGGELPEVIYSANDEMAIGIMRYLNHDKKLVPKQVKIIGYDDIELSSYITPSLTSIHVNRDSWAKYIAKELIERIEDKNQEGTIEPFVSTYSIERRETF